MTLLLMSSRKLKIVSVASEVAPFSKTGGLADVARSLPKALKRLGHEVMIITPLYGQIIDIKEHGLKLIHENVEIYLNSADKVKVNYWRGSLMKNLAVYFIENKKYFSSQKAIYGTSHDNARFLVFNVAALKLISLLKYPPDIIHCHDWHAGLIPYFLKTDFKGSETMRKAKTVFTIHNLHFQLGRSWMEVPLDKKDDGKKKLPHLDDSGLEYINFAKRAIRNADFINTVSEQYREEILTVNFGQDLHRILRNRQDRLYGIINGIDFSAYNPLNDPGLAKNYDYHKIGRKKTNKIKLQKMLKLKADQELPIIASTSRVTSQKGFELILEIMEPLLRLDAQLVIIGDGDKKYIDALKKISKRYPKKMALLPFEKNKKLETLIYAGSDIFLLPSSFEPCGINQLIAMRYGCVPVVRRVGGLQDTVINYNPKTKRGNGFSFSTFNPYSLFATIVRALENYRHEDKWRELIGRIMKESNSWEIPARKYVALYRKALKIK